MSPRFLFICKIGAGYGYTHRSASGLRTSAQLVVDMLNASGIPAKVVNVIDNNDIDREVSAFKPTHVVIEALWVVPSKFPVLHKLHPKVTWIVRVHSDLPFLAEEGIGMQWLFEYIKHPSVRIAFNLKATFQDFAQMVNPGNRYQVLYLPNYYPAPARVVSPLTPGVLKVGCFGAIRSLKNQLMQAAAAIRYADSVARRLEFNINSGRVAGQFGQSILNNIRYLFKDTQHKLVEWPWLDRKEFLSIIAKMDIELAVSMTETFCIVAADAIASGVPLICSAQIPWAASSSIVAASTNAIIAKLGELTNQSFRTQLFDADKAGLTNYGITARLIWTNPANYA